MTSITDREKLPDAEITPNGPLLLRLEAERRRVEAEGTDLDRLDLSAHRIGNARRAASNAPTPPTTSTAPERTAVTATDMRTDMERLWESVRNGHASDEWAATVMRDHRPDLAPWDRWAIWEQLDDAFSRLACLRMAPCPCHDYALAEAELFEQAADTDVEDAVHKLIGRTA